MMTPHLVVTDALGRRQIPLEKPLITLGRRSESDVRISGTGVSRHHAEIAVHEGAYCLRDLASKFGTFVNGERTNGDRRLAHGDRIRLGDSDETEIVFLLGEDTDASRERSAISAATELRHMASLLEGLRALGSGRVLDDVLTLVLDSAIDTTGAERGFIMLASDAGQLEFKVGRARGRMTLSGQTFATSRKIPESVFASGTQMIVDDLLDDTLAGKHQGTVALGIRHVLCTPLRLVRYVERAEERGDEKMIGVLYLDSRERGALHSHSVRTALETLSTEAAVAIENARLYREALERAKLDQELRVAAAIQRSLLPASHRSGAFFSTAGTSLPCRAVGGDFFDYVDLSSGEFGFILGDVAGKGAPAALLASAVLGMFGAEAAYQSGAAAMVSRLNHGLFRRGIEARFVTAFYGLLAADGTLTYSNAGHNPPLLVGRGSVRRLETGGLVLGLFADAAWEQECVALAPGDVVVSFSDGVSEAVNEAGDDYGDDRLLASVQRHAGGTLQALLDGVLADLRAFCGKATPNDDLTLVVVRYDGLT